MVEEVESHEELQYGRCLRSRFDPKSHYGEDQSEAYASVSPISGPAKDI